MSRYFEIKDLWDAHRKLGTPKEDIAAEIYTHLTGRTASRDVRLIQSIQELDNFMVKENVSGNPHSFSGMLLFMIALPNIIIFIAIITSFIKPPSFFVIGSALLAKFLANFARYISTTGHPAAAFWILLSLAMIICALAISVIQLFGLHRFS